jgi:ferredoxin
MYPKLKIQTTCTKCDSCKVICPEQAVIFDEKYMIDTYSCTLCNLCVYICPEDCIKIEEEEA